MTSAAPIKSVVLCADDYALNAPTSQGIVALCVLGRLSATSVMVHSPRWADEAAALREMRDRVDVGLHLDWTSTFAQAAGFGHALGGVMGRSLWGGFRHAAVCDEVERQLDAFEAHWQAPPDHVDGHQHVQQFPGLRDLLLDVLTRRYAHRPWLRVSQVGQPDFKAAIITRWGARAWQRRLQAAGWQGLAPLRGAYDFTGGHEAYAQRMRGWLAQARRDGGLIMCHPAQGVDETDDIGEARAWEYAYLASDAFAHDLRAADLHLVRGRALHLPS